MSDIMAEKLDCTRRRAALPMPLALHGTRIKAKTHAGAHKYRRVEEFSGVVVLAMPGKVELGLAKGREKTARRMLELPVDGPMSPSVTSRFKKVFAVFFRRGVRICDIIEPLSLWGIAVLSENRNETT